MDKEKYIISKIVTESTLKADALILAANKRAREALLETKKDAAAHKEAVAAKTTAGLKDLTERKIKNAELDLRKDFLTQKQMLLDRVFLDVKNDLLKLKDKEYCDLIKKIITANIDDVDTIVVCKNDEKRLSDTFIKSVGTALKKKLTRKVSDSFNGGVILEGKSYDKVFTFDSLLKVLRANLETQVAQILFE